MVKFKDILNELEIRPQLNSKEFYRICREIIDTNSVFLLEAFLNKDENDINDLINSYDEEDIDNDEKEYLNKIKIYREYFNNYSESDMEKLIVITYFDGEGWIKMKYPYKICQILSNEEEEYLVVHNDVNPW